MAATATAPRPAPPAIITKATLRAEALAWAEWINVKPRRIQVQAMSSKWASCSTLGTITLSLDLLAEPSDFREGVIVHELVHLLVPNHGRVFKALMKAYVPEWERIAAERVSGRCGVGPGERGAPAHGHGAADGRHLGVESGRG